MDAESKSFFIKPKLAQLRHHRVEVQEIPFAMDPMTIIRHEQDFCACLESRGPNIYIKIWTPSQEDLEMYPNVQFSSKNQWDPQQVQFPSYSLLERAKIKSRNVSSIVRSMERESMNIGGMELEEFNDVLIASIKTPTWKINNLVDRAIKRDRIGITQDIHIK